MHFKLGIIGAGAMASALIVQMLKKNAVTPADITIYDIDAQKSHSIHSNTHVSSSAKELIASSHMIMLAVKPQHYKDITEQNTFPDDKIVISIMAGVKIATLRKSLASNCGILRVMPNMPCSIGQGISALCFDKINQPDKAKLAELFSACGDIIEIDENKFDAVTSVSGSGPAYVYMFAQGMIKGGMQGGLTYDESKSLAISTLQGASALAKLSDQPLDDLVDKVCSKGGTTIEAVTIYKEKGLIDIIAQGIDACRKKSQTLSQKL